MDVNTKGNHRESAGSCVYVRDKMLRLVASGLVGFLGALVAGTVVAGKPVRSGSLYIPTWEGRSGTQGQVLEFDSRTGELKRVLIPPLGIDLIYGMTLGPDRNLYLSLFDSQKNINGRIVRFSLDGQSLGEFVSPGEGGLVSPMGLRFAPDGNLYVLSSSTTTDQVLRYTPRKGRFDGVIGSNLTTPQDIVFGPDGLLYASNGNYFVSSIYQFDPANDTYLGAFVPTALGGLRNPVGMAFGSDGNLYVASFANNSVYRFDGNTGAFIDVFATLDGLGLDTPSDLVFGPDENLYVLARSTTVPYGAVVRFDGTTGAFIDVFIGVGADGLGIGNTGMLFIDEACSQYADHGFGNRCFPARSKGTGRQK